MLPDHQVMPGLARLINQLGDGFSHQAEALVRLDEKELLDRISHRLSLKDYGDSYYKEGLRQLIDEVKNDADLTFLGKVLFLAEEMDRNLFSRKHNGIDVHDILYEEILSDPLGVVKKFYYKSGIEMPAGAEEKMKIFIRKNRQHRHGQHKYRSDDFGIRMEDIMERFEEYMHFSGYKAKNA